MRKKLIIFAFIFAILSIAAIMVGPIMSNVEHPKYIVTSSMPEENIEIRVYDPMIIAAVQVKGQRDEAIGDGFRILADYIFGNNVIDQSISMTAPVQQEENAQIPMTAPVQQQKSQKIDMTAPVQQSASGNAWTVSFVMPSQFDMNTLPKPNDNRVKLAEITQEKYIVVQFSGSASDKNIKQYEKLLKAYIAENNIQTIGTPKYAFYNPPWTLPMMRRNEIMIKMK